MLDGFLHDSDSVLRQAREAVAGIPDSELIPHSFAWQLKHGSLKTADAIEPLFVLRGQDRSAPAAVNAWANNAVMQNVDDTKIEMARHCADMMVVWDGPKKTPD
jgi:hypothetical protein